MEYAGKNTFSEARGEMEVPLESANSCDQPIFYAQSYYCIKTWKNTIAYAGKMYKICAFKGIGNLYATYSIYNCMSYIRKNVYIK